MIKFIFVDKNNTKFNNASKLNLKMSINEEEYFKSIVEMRGTFGMKVKLWRVCDIFKKVNMFDIVNQSYFMGDAKTSESFLYKCYIDAVMELGGIIGCMFRCVENGVFHKPRDVGGEDSDDEDGYKDEEYYEKLQQKRNHNMEIFKDAVIRAIFEIDRARIKVAKALTARANNPSFIKLFERFSPPNLGGQNMLVEMYRCLRHIHSGDIDFDYKFGNKLNIIDMFDSMFCSKNTVADYAFFANARASFDEPVNTFDIGIIQALSKEK